MRRMFYFLSFGVVAAIISASQVRSEPLVCANHNEIVARLAQHFGETQRATGMRDNHLTVEVFISPDTGSWTIAETNGAGLTCLVAAGQAYQYRAGILAHFLEGLEQQS